MDEYDVDYSRVFERTNKKDASMSWGDLLWIFAIPLLIGLMPSLLVLLAVVWRNISN